MPGAERHGVATLQGLLVRLVKARDPAAAPAGARVAAGADSRLLADVEIGPLIAALLVAKLRFQRLLSASREAAAWFERDGRAFTEAFRAYHTSQPSVALDPWGEAAAFARWCAEERLSPGASHATNS